MSIDRKEIDIRFTYHPPTDLERDGLSQRSRYETLRQEANLLARKIAKWCPESRESSLALTKLEEAIFWANAAIARREGLTNKEE